MNAAKRTKLNTPNGKLGLSEGHDSRAIANEFIKIFFRNTTHSSAHQRVTPLSLQKLVFIAHAISLAETNIPLANELAFVGKFSIFFPTLKESLSFFGGIKVNKEITYGTGEEVYLSEPSAKPVKSNFSEDQLNLIGKVWEAFESVNYDCTRLTILTIGSPTEFTELKENIKVDNPIPNELIKKITIERFKNNKSYCESAEGEACAA